MRYTVCSPWFGVRVLSSGAVWESSPQTCFPPSRCSGLYAYAGLEEASRRGTDLGGHVGGLAKADQCRLKSTVGSQLVKITHK